MEAVLSWPPETAKKARIGAQIGSLYSEGATLFAPLAFAIVPNPDVWFPNDDGNGNGNREFACFFSHISPLSHDHTSE